MDSRKKQQLKLQQLLSKVKESRYDQLLLPTFKDSILWQGNYLDGHLTIISTSDPSILFFFLESIDNYFSGNSIVIKASSPESMVDNILQGITECYHQMIMEERQEQPTVLH